MPSGAAASATSATSASSAAAASATSAASSASGAAAASAAASTASAPEAGGAMPCATGDRPAAPHRANAHPAGELRHRPDSTSAREEVDRAGDRAGSARG
jgi:hypothetical protein